MPPTMPATSATWLFPLGGEGAASSAPLYLMLVTAIPANWSGGSTVSGLASSVAPSRCEGSSSPGAKVAVTSSAAAVSLRRLGLAAVTVTVGATEAPAAIPASWIAAAIFGASNSNDKLLLLLPVGCSSKLRTGPGGGGGGGILLQEQVSVMDGEMQQERTGLV